MFLSALICQPTGAADQRHGIENKDAVVLFDAPLESAAKEVMAVCPAIRTELENLLGWQCRFRPVIVLIKDEDIFRKMAGHDLFVAFAVPEKKYMVIDFSKMGRDPFTLEITLKHELCHLLLHDHIQKADLPRWLDEGVAQWACGGISELLTAKKESLLDEAVLTGNCIPFRSLGYRFPREKTGLTLAYNQSKSMVTYITETFGKACLLKILGYLKAGDDADIAVRKSLLISFQELEARWYESVKKRTSWLVYAAIHLYDILFFLAALTTVLGFIRLTVRKKTYKDEEEEEEGEEDDEF